MVESIKENGRCGPKPKVYDENTLKMIDNLFNDGKLSIKKIIEELHTHRNVFYRNMEAYYGRERWDEIVEVYRSRRGIRKGQRISTATEFKKDGPLRYVNARRYRAVGKFQIKARKVQSKRGRPRLVRTRWIKVDDVINGKNNWKVYARYLWEEKYGPIPKGMCIVHLDRDNLNDDFDNLAMMTKGDYIRYLQSRFPEREKIIKARMKKSRTSVKRIKFNKEISVWECSWCEYQPLEKIEKCPKCGHEAFEKIIIKQKIA